MQKLFRCPKATAFFPPLWLDHCVEGNLGGWSIFWRSPGVCFISQQKHSAARHYLHQRTFLFFSCKSSAVMENLSNKQVQFPQHSWNYPGVSHNMYKSPGEATVRGSGGSQVARAPVSLLEHQLQILFLLSSCRWNREWWSWTCKSNQGDLRSAMCFWDNPQMASPLLLRRVLLFSTLLVKPTIPSHIYASIHEVSQMKLKKINLTDVMVQVSMMAGRPLLDPIMAYLEVLI